MLMEQGVLFMNNREQPTLLSNTGCPSAAPQPVRGFAGFWIRALCFILDIIILNFFFKALNFVFRERLFEISAISEYLGAGIVFFYFFLLNGPAGKGRTIAKHIFQVRTQSENGEPLSYKDALIRTIIQFLSSHLVVLLLMPGYQSSTASLALALVGFMSFSFAFLVSNALLVGVNPLKKGFHDILSGSVVVKGAELLSYKDIENLKNPSLAVPTRRSPASARQTAILAFVIIFAIQSFNGYREFRSERWRARLGLLSEMRRNFPVDGFKLEEVMLIPLRPERPDPAVTEPASTKDEETTPTAVEAGTASLQYRVLVYYLTGRDITPAEIEAGHQAGLIRDSLGPWLLKKLEMEYSALVPQDHKPVEIKVIFLERYSLFIFSHEKSEMEFTIPLDPGNTSGDHSSNSGNNSR